MLLTDFIIFVLSLWVGFEVISKVPATLHTPLMSAANSIHGIVLAGAIVIAATAHNVVGYILAFVAVAFAAMNVVGGYGLPGEIFSRFTRTQQAWLGELLESASAHMLKQAQKRARKLGVPSIQLESRRGDVAQTILEIAEDLEVDAIVVGKRGAGQVAGMLLGSVSQKLVSLATRVVIVVP